ncbi:hypothetical protein GW776_00835 [archaeon]|nr:hypothetical protein [archaeon]
MVVMSLVNIERGILNFGVYKELFPLVINTYKFLEENKSSINDNFIFQETISNLINILSFLSKGYNKYHSNEKSLLYSYSRDCVSTTQSNLLILSEINKDLSKDKILFFYNQFEEKIKYFNGLIKKIEENKK